jgi:hypothetical protein
MSYSKFNPMISEKDKVLLKRYNLLSLLANQKFIQYAASLVESYQARNGTGIPLSVAVDLISTAAKYEPDVSSSLASEDHSVRDHVLYLFSLAVVDKLADTGYLGSTSINKERPSRAQPETRRSVFIVHRGSPMLTNEITSILQKLGLEGILLEDTPIAAMTIMEKLETYSNVGYAIVVLDRSLTQDRLLARGWQNIIFEFGYFVGLIGRDRVCCLIQEGVDLPSEIAGIRYLRFHESISEVMDNLIRELRVAGYKVRS